MENKVLMLGNEAIARGAYEAGVKVSAAYPGTPSTEISENIIKYKEIYSEWSPNEKVAMEVAAGASITGVRALVSMKHVGVNVASDPLYTMSYIGAYGGLVLVAADDPGLYSSQNEQDSRAVARASKIPVIEPSDSSEAKNFVKTAFDISEEFDTPVILRTTTRVAHSQGLVELQERVEREDKPYVKNIQKNVMMPGNAVKRHLYVEKREKEMALAAPEWTEIYENGVLVEGAKKYALNKMELTGSKVGVISSGIPYQYVKEAMPDANVLKLGIVNPLPRKLIEEFAAKVDTLYIVEELDPIIEEQVKSWGIKCIGKEILTVQGEYSANMLKKAILKQELDLDSAAAAPVRPPILCPGCPHRATFYTLSKMKIHAAGDIGCYTLGAVAPLSVVDTTICMGASISSLHGMEKARGKEFIKDWVAVIGDSTFMHTGINSLVNMVYNQASGTVLILDNSTTGMTGHQDHAATGKTLMGEIVPAVNIPELCKAIGVKNVVTVNAFDTALLEKTIREENEKDEVSVIIVKAPCALLDKRPITVQYKVDPDKCRKCGMCMKPGCPAITKGADGITKINDTMCNGCGLCAGICKFGAIEKVELTK